MSMRSDPLSPRELQRRAVAGASWTLLHTLVSLPLAFVVNIFLARILGVVDYGRLALLTAVMVIAATIVSSGVGAALTQFGAKAHAAGRRREVQDLLSRNQGFRLSVAAPLLTLTVLLIVDLPPILMIIALVFGVWVPAFAAGGPAGLTLENRTAAAARLALVTAILTQGSIVVVLLLAPTAEIIWATRTIVGGLFALMALFIISKDYRRAAISPRSPVGLSRAFWSFAVPASASGIIGVLAFTRSETVLLELLSRPVEVGVYALAFGLAGHLFAPAQALLAPLIPAVSGLREVDPSTISRAFLRTLRASSTIGGLILAGGAPALALLVPAIYGSEFQDARGLVLALAVLAGFNLVSAPMEAFTSARLRAKSMLLINAGTLLLGIVVGVASIPAFGAWGAVCAKAAMTMGRLTLFLIFERASFDVGIGKALRASQPLFLSAVIGSAAYSIALSMMEHSVDTNMRQSIVAAMLCGAGASLIFLCALWVTRSGLDSDDAKVLHSQFPVAWRRNASRWIRLLAHSKGSV